MTFSTALKRGKSFLKKYRNREVEYIEGDNVKFAKIRNKPCYKINPVLF